MKRMSIILILIVTFFTTCKGPAIFETLEKEEKIIDLNNFKSSSPIIRFKRCGSYYVINGKQLWYSRSGTSEPWHSVNVPGVSKQGTYPSIAVLGNTLYFVASDQDSNSYNAIYSMTSMTGSPTKHYSSQRRYTNNENYQYESLALFSVEGVGLYVVKVTRAWKDYSTESSSIVKTEVFLYQNGEKPNSLDAAHKVTLTGFEGKAYLINDVVQAGSKIYLILNLAGKSKGSVLSGDGRLLVSTDNKTFQEESTQGSYDYNRMYFAQSHLFLSTRSPRDYNPILYKKIGASTNWKTIKSSSSTEFSAFADISPIKPNTLLVGTQSAIKKGGQGYTSGKGYYEIHIGNSGPSLSGNTFSDRDNYNSTALKDATITDIYCYSGDSKRVYIGTSSKGLWLNKKENANKRKWYQE